MNTLRDRPGWTDRRPWQASTAPSPYWLAAALVVGPFLLVVIAGQGSARRALFCVAIVFLVMGLVSWKLLRLEVIWAKVRRHRRMLCFNCLYPLGEIRAAGRCPECGEPYTIEETQSKWRSAEQRLRRGWLVLPDPEPDPNDRPGGPDT